MYRLCLRHYNYRRDRNEIRKVERIDEPERGTVFHSIFQLDSNLYLSDLAKNAPFSLQEDFLVFQNVDEYTTFFSTLIIIIIINLLMVIDMKSTREKYGTDYPDDQDQE